MLLATVFLSVVFRAFCGGGEEAAASSASASVSLPNRTANHHHHHHRRHHHQNVSRLQCLQKSFGAERIVEEQTGHWKKGHIDALANKSDEKQWIYQDSECIFMPFHHQRFCQE